MSVEFDTKEGDGDMLVGLVFILILFLMIMTIVLVPTIITTNTECNRLHEINGWDTRVRFITCYVRLDGHWIPSEQIGYYLGGGR
jgi:hypothetical protein